MQQSLIQIKENEAREIVLTYINSEHLDCTKKPETQEIVMSKEDALEISEMLYNLSHGEG